MPILFKYKCRQVACRSFSKEAVGKINGELVIKQTEDEFLEAAKNNK